MTVGELKAILKDKDDNLIVLRGDNSGGYENIYEVESEVVRDNFDQDADKVAVVIK